MASRDSRYSSPMRSRRRAKEALGVGTMLVLALFPIVFMAGGAALFYGSWRHREWAKESPSWPQVNGRIVRISGNRGSTTITYAYGAGGKFYQTSRAVLGSITPGEQQQLARGLFPGKDVKVYVHPDDPSLSVLFPGSRPANLVMPITGVAGILVGLGIGWLMIRMVRMEE